MKPQVQEAIEAELLKRAQKDLKHVAITMVREGPGVIINEPLKSRYDQILHNYSDRSSIQGSDEVTPASAAFNRARYALANVEDLGAPTLVRAIGDLWRAGGGTCVRKDIGEEALVNQVMIGTPGRPKIEAAKLLSTTCGTLTPAEGRVALHGLGALAERFRHGHVYMPVGAALAGVNFGGLDLSGAVLQRADLRQSRLAGAIFRRSDLAGSNMTGARLFSADFSDADVTGAKMSNTDLRQANFARAKMSGVNLQTAQLAQANFQDADLSGVTFAGARVRLTNFAHANLSHAEMRGLIFQSTNLAGADITGADLRGADLTDADLAGADLSNALRAPHDDSVPGWVLVGGRLRPAKVSP